MILNMNKHVHIITLSQMFTILFHPMYLAELQVEIIVCFSKKPIYHYAPSKVEKNVSGHSSFKNKPVASKALFCFCYLLS